MAKLPVRTVALTGGVALVCLMLAGCAQTQPKVQRVGMVIGVKPEKIEYYKELHANPWPGVIAQLGESNIENFSIYLGELREGEWYLFGYYEYTGDDFEADMAAMAEDATTIRWWRETDPCQFPLPTNEEGKGWSTMEEVFFME